MVFQKKVRDIYLRVSETDDHLAVIDCSNNVGAMLPAAEIFDLIIRVLNKRKLI
jgi:thymidylate kinase